MADMTKYASASFIKVDDLAEERKQKVMTKIEKGKYDKPVVTFEDGTKLSLNGTNVRTLIRALGPNPKDWIDKRVELYAGTVRFDGKDTASVLLRALDVVPAAERTPPDPQPLEGDLDDAIPF